MHFRPAPTGKKTTRCSACRSGPSSSIPPCAKTAPSPCSTGSTSPRWRRGVTRRLFHRSGHCTIPTSATTATQCCSPGGLRSAENGRSPVCTARNSRGTTPAARRRRRRPFSSHSATNSPTSIPGKPGRNFSPAPPSRTRRTGSAPAGRRSNSNRASGCSPITANRTTGSAIPRTSCCCGKTADKPPISSRVPPNGCCTQRNRGSWKASSPYRAFSPAPGCSAPTERC